MPSVILPYLFKLQTKFETMAIMKIPLDTDKSYTLRLQSSILEELRKVADEQGTTLDQYVNVALAEKLAAMRDFAYSEARQACRYGLLWISWKTAEAMSHPAKATRSLKAG
jgi:predicted DNA-binding protein